MDAANNLVETYQESHLGDKSGTAYPQQFSTSITTGQEGSEVQHWTRKKGKAGTYRSLGNNRAPIPTCGITVKHPSQNLMMMDSKEVQPWSDTAKLSDLIIGQPEVQFPATEPVSTHSNSMESVQELTSISPGSENGSRHRSDQVEFCSDEDDLLEMVPTTTNNRCCSLQQLDKATYKRKIKEKKSVGRPLAYKGDPEAPELTDQERRRIKRRIANRESARRVRHKRLEVLEDMQIKMEQLNAHNFHLEHRAEEVEGQRAELVSQLEALQGKHSQTVEENRMMQEEIKALRQSLQVKMNALEDELDKRAKEIDGPEIPTAFAGPVGQALPNQGPLCNFSDAEQNFDIGKSPLDWLPSLNLDNMPQKSDAWDMLNTFCLGSQMGGSQTPVG